MVRRQLKKKVTPGTHKRLEQNAKGGATVELSAETAAVLTCRLLNFDMRFVILACVDDIIKNKKCTVWLAGKSGRLRVTVASSKRS